MPSYKVLEKGFFGGVMYSPEKRPTLHTDKGFAKNKVPSWLEPIASETAAQKKARLAKETKAKKASEQKAKEDKEDIDAVSFLASSSTTSVVEDL